MARRKGETMNEQIKQRIIQLNNGEIPSGYEKTEFGIFPCDWVVDKRLKDVGTFGKGKGLPGDKMTLKGVPCVGYGDIYMKYNNFHFEKAKSFVDEETASESQPIQKGTLLFTGTGETAEEIGKCVCYNGDETIYAGGDIITFISNEVNPLFLAYQQYQGFSLRNKASFGQGHSVVHIRQNNLEKLHVAYPKSADEQSKIAEILMKWDEMVELQEQYIQKLEQREHSVVKTTINSVIGESKKIKECVSYHPSSLLIKNLKEEENGFPVYGANDITMHISTYSFECNAVAIIKYGSSAGRVSFLTGKHSVLGTMAEMLPKKNINIKYIYYVLKCFDFKRYIEISTTPNVYFEDYAEEIIQVPNKNVQDRIVKELDIFTEYISLQKEKFERIKTQRKTLQQYLLNGIVRVEV